MRRYLLTALLIASCIVPSLAQPFYQVNHPSGAAVVNGNTITITTIGTTMTSTYCGFGPYFFGHAGVATYNFAFSNPVGQVRMSFAAFHDGEEITFSINGSPYMLSTSQLSPNPGTCNAPFGAAVVNGALVGVPPYWANTVQVDINPGVPINSISLTHNQPANTAAGCSFDFFFADGTFAPCPGIVIAGNNNPCEGSTLNLNASSVTGATYSWVGPNGFTAFMQNPSIANVPLTASGNYIVTAMDTGCIYKDTTIVIVKPKPVPSITTNSSICAGNVLSLNGSSVPAASSYNWAGPNSFSSNLQNPSIANATQAAGGVYTLTATLNGCMGTATANITVNPAPANVVATSIASPCTGGNLMLNANSSTPGVSYSWSGPAGFSSSLQNPIINNVAPANSGTYTVTATNGNCQQTATTNVTVNDTPAAPVAGSNTLVCSGDAINLTAQSVTPSVTYLWTGPLSFSSTQQNPVLTNATVAMTGTYNVRALLGGCPSVLVPVQVVVNPAPAGIVATSNAPLCAGSTLLLNASNNSSGVSYSWTGPLAFSSNIQNPSLPNIMVGNSGIYTVTATLGTCQKTASVNVVVNTPPSTPTVGSNTPVCSGNNINLTASSATLGVTYTWTGPGGYNSNQQNPTRSNATVAMSGIYTITAAVGACPAAPVSVQVIVNQTPTAPVATNNGPLCAGAALDLFATGLAGATYQWNGPAGYNSSVQNPTLLGTTTANAGSYTVTRTVNGCTSAPGTTTVVINNSVNPAIAVFPSPNDTICPGQTVVFVASPNNGGTAPQYQWKKNGNNIAGATAGTYNTSIINSGDFFSCELTSNAACAFPQTVQSNNVLMTVEPPQPCAVSITANPGLVLSPWELVTFTATPTKGGVLPSYQWLRNGKPVIGAVSATWGANNLSSNDTISVVLFSTDPCAVPNTDTSNYLVVNIKTSIDRIGVQDKLGIYPNPNTGSFVVKGKIKSQHVQLAIVNAIGQVLYTFAPIISNGVCNEQIQLGKEIANGVYVLRISGDDVHEQFKFILQR